MIDDLGQMQMNRIDYNCHKPSEKGSPKCLHSRWDRGCRVSANMKEISDGNELIDDLMRIKLIELLSFLKNRDLLSL